MQIRILAAAALLVPLSATTATVAQSPNPKFQAELERLAEWTRKNRAAQHIEVAGEDALAIDPFKDGQLEIPKVVPGASVTVTVPGKYAAGTVVLSERDGITLSGATMSSSSYATRMTVASDEGPGFARLAAMDPISMRPAFKAVAFVDVVYRMDLKSPNGITVHVTPLEKTFTIDELGKNAKVKYQAEFYKPGEAKPFETVTGEQNFNDGDQPLLRFDISFFQSAGSPQAELDKINEQLGDSKLTEAQRNALTERMLKIQQKMVEDMTKGLQTNPTSLNKKEEDFGCRLLQLYPGKAAGAVEGTFICGQNFSGGALKVSGTMTRVRSP